MKIGQGKYFIVSFTVLITVLLNRADAYVGPTPGEFSLDAITPFAFAMLFLVPWLWALIDIMKNKFSGNNKVIWLLVVRVIPVLGFTLYFLIGRKQKKQIEAPCALSKNL